MIRLHLSTTPFIAIAATLTALMIFSSAGAVTLVVDSTTDGPDAIPGDGLCDDGTGVCSFRAALE